MSGLAFSEAPKGEKGQEFLHFPAGRHIITRTGGALSGRIPFLFFFLVCLHIGRSTRPLCVSQVEEFCLGGFGIALFSNCYKVSTIPLCFLGRGHTLYIGNLCRQHWSLFHMAWYLHSITWVSHGNHHFRNMNMRLSGVVLFGAVV